jgi:hypothetical protein
MNTLLGISTLVLALSLSNNTLAEGNSKGGDEFRKTAEKYDAKSDKYRDKGMSEVSELYARQAEIKRNAASLVDQGRWDDIDWTEYHSNEGMINEKLGHMKNKYKHKKEHKK